MMPVYLLAGGAAVHMGYAVFPVEHQALAWNALGAAARLALLALFLYPIKSVYVGLIAAWLVIEELQVIICNTAFAFSPWFVKPGQEMCSAWIGTDLGKFTALAFALLLLAMPNKVSRVTDGNKGA
jgi:hypothetical protein